MNIVLFGAGSHLSYTAEIIELCGDHKIVGVIDSIKPIGEIVNGYKVIGRQENIEALITEYQIEGGIISVGDNFSRGSIYGDIVFRLPDFEFINAIHPSSVVSKDVEIGVGVIVMAGCIINAGAVLNDFCFLATGAQVEHNCVIGHFASVSAGTVLGGYVEIGDFAAVTLGVTILDRLKVGKNSVVGSGSLVLKDLPDNVLAYGNPARVIRERKQGEKYLK